MRELDLLLQTFLTSGLASLGNEDLDRLENLLDAPDQDILAWLTSDTEPDDRNNRAIVNIIRNRIRSCSNTGERRG